MASNLKNSFLLSPMEMKNDVDLNSARDRMKLRCDGGSLLSVLFYSQYQMDTFPTELWNSETLL